MIVDNVVSFENSYRSNVKDFAKKLTEMLGVTFTPAVTSFVATVTENDKVYNSIKKYIEQFKMFDSSLKDFPQYRYICNGFDYCVSIDENNAVIYKDNVEPENTVCVICVDGDNYRVTITDYYEFTCYFSNVNNDLFTSFEK